MDVQMTAGTISTTFFAASNVAMLAKAARTRSLGSYSYAHILMTNVANVVHWFYVASLPPGRIWFLHGFNTIVGALMLLWYLKYERGFGTTHQKAPTRDRDLAAACLFGLPDSSQECCC